MRNDMMESINIVSIKCLVSLAVVLAISCHLIESALPEPANQCKHQIVESMPDGLTLMPPKDASIQSTSESLLDMIDNSKISLNIASFYWMLTPQEKESIDHPSALPGKKIMSAVVTAAKRGVKVQIVLDNSRKSMNNPDDVKKLQSIGQVAFLNMTQVLHAGVLHSKYLIADSKDFYVGSSNFDWRSYTQIKEIGISFKDCPVLAQDLEKLFKTYVLIAASQKIPDKLPDELKTSINIGTPLELKLGSLEAKVFLGGSPPAFNGDKDWTGRTDDIDGLLHIINSAKHRVDISVMNYSPQLQFGWPRRYWPRIDDALRRAASERAVKVRLLFSDWAHANPAELVWYRSLNAIQSPHFRGGGIHVKMFKVPSFDDYQKSIPFARVKHDKYLVTDRGLYIGTSNWTPDYFTSTCGVSVVIEPQVNSKSTLSSPSSIIKNMQDVFDRDFESDYSHELV